MSSAVVPSPVGGWNARDSLADMDPRDAIELVNIIPLGEGCRTRPGMAAWADDIGADNVETLVTYHGEGKGGTETLICATDGDLKNITDGSSPSDLGTGFTNDRWNTAEFGGRIIFCNGADAVRDYDGSLNTTAVYGHNILTNGEFATDSNWTKGTGWTIGSGTASSDGSQAGDSDLTQTPATSIVASQTYVVTFTVSNRSAGNVCAVVGNTEGTDRNADGTYVETITAGAGADFDIRADADFVGDIDNVQIAKTSEDFITCHAHQGRMFYIEDNSQHFYYADAGAYAGYTNRFDLSTQAGTGAKLLFMASWSRDSGSGMDDMAAFYFEDGVIVVYSGDDPGSVNSWSKVGRYKSGAPLGRRAAVQVGGDVVCLTTDGYVPLSAVIAEGQYTEQSTLSFKIDKAAKEAAQTWGDNYGWSATHFPEAGWLVVNVPISSTESVQHVRSTINGAWCKFTAWNANQFAVFGGNLYFGAKDGNVYKVSGTSDNGDFIDFKCIQAYNHLGDPHRKKQINLVQAFVNYGFPKYIDYRIFADYDPSDLPTISDPPESSVSEWDVGEWDVAEWVTESGDRTKIARKNVVGNGFSLALVTRFKSKAQVVNIWATQLIYKYTGII